MRIIKIVCTVAVSDDCTSISYDAIASAIVSEFKGFKPSIERIDIVDMTPVAAPQSIDTTPPWERKK